jgi:hypothetical protein
MEESREKEEFDVLGAVIEAIAVILTVAVLAHITISIRLCHPVQSTKAIIAQLSQLNTLQLVAEVVKAYFIYILLALILAVAVFYTLRMAGSQLIVVPLPGRFSARFLKPAVVFLLLFYLVNLVVSTQYASCTQVPQPIYYFIRGVQEGG